MNNNTLYSAGYEGMDREAFVRFVTSNGIVVADLRHKPVSRNHVWNKNALTSALGGRYVHIPELGNLNYKGSVAEIQIADLPAGVAKLRAMLERSHVLVLCVCRDYRTCHRTVVTKALEPDFPVTHVDAKAILAAVTANALPLSGG